VAADEDIDSEEDEPAPVKSVAMVTNIKPVTHDDDDDDDDDDNNDDEVYLENKNGNCNNFSVLY